MSPYLLYSDGKGNIYEDTSLYALGRSGWDAIPVDEEDWIPLPNGGSMYELPGRQGIGLDVKTGELPPRQFIQRPTIRQGYPVLFIYRNSIPSTPPKRIKAGIL